MKIRVHLVSVLAFVLGFVVACSKNSGGEKGVSSLVGLEGTRVSIPLESVQTEAGCLSAPIYTLALRQLRPDLPLLEASTHISFDGGRGVRDAFRLLTAFGNFKFEQQMGSERIDLHGLSQDGCKLITHTAADGTQEEYKITDSGPDFIVAEASSGNRRSYRWLSPLRVEVTTRHKALDLPCTEGQTFVDLKQILDWSGSIPLVTSKDDPLYVDEAYVKMLSSAVGMNAQDFYTEIPATPDEPTRRGQLASKLMELAKSTVRQELLTCTGAPPVDPAPPVEPTPPENPQTPTPPTDPLPPIDPPSPEDPIEGPENPIEGPENPNPGEGEDGDHDGDDEHLR